LTSDETGGEDDVRRIDPNDISPTDSAVAVLAPPNRNQQLLHNNNPPLSPLPPSPQQKPPASTETSMNKYELAAKKTEKFTSVAIPTLFIIFNCMYWPWLIESSNY